MNARICWAFALGVALGLVAVCNAQSGAKKISWLKSLEAAMAAAKERKCLVMVDFFTDGCAWCKKLDSEVYPDARVVKAVSKMASVRVNAEKEGKDAAAKYKVDAYPTVVFLDAQGEVWGRLPGYAPPEHFAKAAVEVANGFRDFPVLSERLAKNPNDAETALQLAILYAVRSDGASAEGMLAKAESGGSARLAAAYNAVGDCYQGLEEFPKARGFFEKAITAAKDGHDLAYARLSIAACFVAEDAPKEATPYLEAVIAQKDIPNSMKTDAKDMLKAVKGG
jgi:thioredoxin-related protein